MSQKWSAKSVATQISALYRDGSKLHSRYIRKQYPALYGAANYHCGGWAAAIRVAGLDYSAVRSKSSNPNKVWTKPKVIAEILARFNSGLSLNYHAVATSHGALIQGAVRCFGCWRNAITAAGFDYSSIQKVKHQKWNKVEIVLAIIARHEAGLSIKGGDVKNTALYYAASRHFGKKGWSKARVFAGFDPFDPYPWQKWTAKKVTAEIRKLHSAGVPLNTGAIVGNSSLERLRTAGRKIFGKWALAINAAGLDYSKIRLQRHGFWIKSRILRAIQKLDKIGVRLNSRSIRVKFPGMYGAALREFGGWSQAVEAAGISYRQHCKIWSTKAWLLRMHPEEYRATLTKAQVRARQLRRKK